MKTIQIEQQRLGRICADCDERYIPDGKYQKYCINCQKRRTWRFKNKK